MTTWSGKQVLVTGVGGGMGTAVATVIEVLLLEGASDTTGQVCNIDGGMINS